MDSTCGRRNRRNFHFGHLSREFLWKSELTGPIFSIDSKDYVSDFYSVTAYGHPYFYYTASIVLFTYTLGKKCQLLVLQTIAFVQNPYRLSQEKRDNKITKIHHLAFELELRRKMQLYYLASSYLLSKLAEYCTSRCQNILLAGTLLTLWKAQCLSLMQMITYPIQS